MSALPEVLRLGELRERPRDAPPLEPHRRQCPAPANLVAGPSAAAASPGSRVPRRDGQAARRDQDAEGAAEPDRAGHRGRGQAREDGRRRRRGRGRRAVPRVPGGDRQPQGHAVRRDQGESLAIRSGNCGCARLPVGRELFLSCAGGEAFAGGSPAESAIARELVLLAMLLLGFSRE